MLKEFKEFITGGNVIEFAVAVIMAGAIGGVVKGFVDNIVMPFVGYFTGGTNFENMFLAMDGKEYETLAAAKEAGAIHFEGSSKDLADLLLSAWEGAMLMARIYNNSQRILQVENIIKFTS